MKLTKIFNNLLLESQTTEFIAYHGTDHIIKKFEDSFISGEKVIQHHGAGIYFTTNIENARMFGKNIYKVHLSGNFIDTKTPKNKVKINEIISLMKMSSEDWSMEAQNYDENPKKGIQIAAKSALNYGDNEADVFLRVQSSWYQYDGLGYVRNMTKLGYDGMIVDAPRDWVGDKHIIVFNPNIIKFIKK